MRKTEKKTEKAEKTEGVTHEHCLGPGCPGCTLRRIYEAGGMVWRCNCGSIGGFGPQRDETKRARAHFDVPEGEGVKVDVEECPACQGGRRAKDIDLGAAEAEVMTALEGLIGKDNAARAKAHIEASVQRVLDEEEARMGFEKTKAEGKLN